MIKRQKVEAMGVKYYKNRTKISLSSRKKRNYEANIRDNTNLNKDNNKYLL